MFDLISRHVHPNMMAQVVDTFVISAARKDALFTVTPASRADISDLSQLLAVSFQDDPPTRIVLRPVDHQDMLARAFHLFRAMLSAGPVDAGLVDTVRVDGQIVGAAIWEAPGQANSASVLGYLRHLPDYVRAIGIAGLPRAISFQATVAQHRPGAPAWYLHAIGVAPQFRGQGIASQLLRHRLSTVDAKGEPAYLESSTPLTGKLYRRHGFQSLRPIPLADGATPHAMWRPPSTD